MRTFYCHGCLYWDDCMKIDHTERPIEQMPDGSLYCKQKLTRYNVMRGKRFSRRLNEGYFDKINEERDLKDE